MKKKYQVPSGDREDWISFTKEINNIKNKENISINKNAQKNKVKILDLHGHSLDEANEIVKEFIIKSYNNSYKKLLIITGKGLRSKSHKNPYVSKNLSILKYSVPDYINNNENLTKKITKISKADIKDGGDGAFYIFLKSKRKIKE